MNTLGMAVVAAVKKNRYDIIEFLLERHPINLNRVYLVRSKPQFVNMAPLQAAVARFDPKSVKLLLSKGASPNLSISGNHNNLLELTKHYHEHCQNMLNEKLGIAPPKLDLLSMLSEKTSDEWSSMTILKLQETLISLNEIITILQSTIEDTPERALTN